MAFLYILIFIASCAALAVSGNLLVGALARIAHFFKLREFIVSFFLMSFATSIPELFVGITSALKGIPELSFGNIVGQNIIHFTLAVTLCVFILKELDIESKVVQISSFYTIFIAILPLILLLDGSLSRIDGIILISSFFAYSLWLFSKKEHFVKEYEHPLSENLLPGEQLKIFLKDIFLFVLGAVLLIVSAQGIIYASLSFANMLSVPLVVIGTLIVGAGTALPETFFSISSARKRNAWMLIGNLMGATVVSSSIVLGIVSIIQPIVVTDFSPYLISRAFLIISALLFLMFLKTGRKITLKEGAILLSVYILFLIVEMLSNS